jgi:transposase-like protein
VGINHHWKNTLFGCAFLIDETTESFIWMFETFLAAIGGRQPKSIFSDQDQAMANAVKVVFPRSRHRLCLWHISKNARQHLAGLYSS